MKVKNTLYDPLINRGKILSKAEIVTIIEEYDKKFKTKMGPKFLNYLSRHNYIKRIFSQIYYIQSFDERNRNFLEFEDKEILFMVLNKLKIRWYVGLGSSLYLQGKTWQTPNQISIVNTRFSGIKKILGLKVAFFKTKESLIFGLKKMQTKHKIEYFYSDPAKTHIDMVYFRKIKSLIRIKNTQKYLNKFPKIYRRDKREFKN
jgi:predicted transcriptional regulator of viral defense system